MMTTTDNDVHVLYVDYNGHATPLSYCFQATASRQLSSSFLPECNPPSTTSHEFDSAYCPQCLKVYDIMSATTTSSSSGGGGYCDTCKQCPLCQAVAVVAIVDNDQKEGNSSSQQSPPEQQQHVACFKCGYCSWTSQQCQMAIPVSSADKNKNVLSKEEWIQIRDQLLDMCKTRTSSSNDETKNRFQTVLSAWQQDIKSSSLSSSSSVWKRSTKQHTSSLLRQRAAWSLEALHDSMLEKSSTNKKTRNFLVEHQTVESSESNKDKDKEHDNDDGTDIPPPSIQSVLMQPIATGSGTTTTTTTSRSSTSLSSLYPLSMPLRSRTTLRCRDEVKHGKPGIVLKPKLHPLDGDSSYKRTSASATTAAGITGSTGQWWKKNSSAQYLLPNVKSTTRIHGSSATSAMIMTNDNEEGTTTTNSSTTAPCRLVCLLQVVNPTMGMVRMRLKLHDDKTNDQDDNDACHEQLHNNKLMKHVLLVNDISFQRTRANILVRHPIAVATTESTPTMSSSSSSLVELEAVQDYIFDLEQRAQLPEAVVNWKPSSSSGETSTETSPSSSMPPSSFIRLVAVQKDTAWFEVHVVYDNRNDDNSSSSSSDVTKDVTDDNVRVATPLAMEIQVGDGSWESSLIKKRDDMEGRPDFASFDLFVVWPPAVAVTGIVTC